ncbi:MAG: TolC family protein [Clostridium sp.]|nr:TolC family protein [Clostridium sp.]
MKKVLIGFLIYCLAFSSVYAKTAKQKEHDKEKELQQKQISPPGQSDDMIWDYRSDKFLESLKSGHGIYDDKTQKELDKEIMQGLDINLLPVDLECCIKIAMENNYDVKISGTKQEESKWTYRNSMTELLPDFYYRYQIQALHGEFLVGDILPRVIDTNPIYSGIMLNYPLVGNGSPLFDIASDRNLYKAAKHNFKYTQSELLLNTTLYYYDLLEAKLNIEVLISNLRDRTEQLKLMQARYHIGIGTKYDILRAEAQYADAKQQLIGALNTLRLKQARLANIMGIEVTTTLYPFEHGVQPRELIHNKNNIEGLYNMALQAREDVLSKRAQIRSLTILKNKNYTDFAPNISLSYEFARVGTTNPGSLRPNHTWSLNVQVPLGKRLGLGTITQKNVDLAKLKTARYELTNLERDIKENIVSSYYSSRTALEKIEANKKQVLSADEGLKFSLIGFDVGQNTFIDVLTSQTEKTTARQQLIQSVIEYNKAQAQLLFDTGIITPKALLLNYKGLKSQLP